MAQDEVVSSTSDQDSDSESEEDDEGDLAKSFDPSPFITDHAVRPYLRGWDPM